MKLINNKWITVGIIKSGKGEKWHWKATYVPHRASMADMRYTTEGSGSSTYIGTHYFITTFLQVFWLWFIVYVDIKKEKLSDCKYVSYEATHYSDIDEALKSNL